jgi:hypothetical protein
MVVRGPNARNDFHAADIETDSSAALEQFNADADMP